MITKERLEELIRQGATVYCTYRDFILQNIEKNLSDFWYRQTAEIKDNKFHYTYEASDYYEDFDVWLELKQLFETKEDAEFARKYQNITRTETLSLPTWEEFVNNEAERINFIGKNGLKYGFGRYICFNTLYITCDCSRVIFDKEITKENYLSACELCRKLFLGEVEE